MQTMTEQHLPSRLRGRLLASAASFSAVALAAGAARAQTQPQQDLTPVPTAPPPVDRAPASASASAAVSEVVVTAQRRGENLQTVPIAISALSGEAMQQRGINSIQSIVQATPTLYQAEYTVSSSTLFLFMRGMGLGDPIQITKDGAIGIYENGIYNSRPQVIAFDLADVERVEILRGPQGTLYGRNTTGGAVNIISRPPSGEFGVRQLASYASRNQYRSVTNIDLPEFAKVSIKGTLAVGGDDGFAENRHAPGVPETNDFNSEHHVAGRIAARWRPTDDFTADYSFQIGRIETTPMLLVAPALNGIEVVPGIPYEADPYRAYRPAFLPESVTRIRDHSLILEWRPSANLTLRSLTGFRHYRSFTYQDTLEAYFTVLTPSHHIHSDQFSQELQAVGSAADGRVKYTLGLYYFREKASHLQTFDFGPGGASDFNIYATSMSKAAYAQVTVTPPILQDRMDITIGGRVTQDTRRASRDQFFNGFPLEIGTSNAQRFTRFNPSFTVSYRWTDYVNSYAKVATGYRAGGSSETTPDFTQTYGPESLTSYEVGLKTELFDRRVRANLAAFYNEYDDVQLDLTTDPDNPTITATLNAGSANLKGFEAEIAAAPTRDLRLDLSYAYLDTEIAEVVGPNGGDNLADLFRIPYAPRHSVNASVDLTLWRLTDATVRVRADYSYKSKVWNSAGAGPAVPGNQFYVTDGFSNVNARLSFQSDLNGRPFEVAIFAQNLLDNDKPSITTAVGSQASGFLLSNYAYAEPRAVGVEVSISY